MTTQNEGCRWCGHVAKAKAEDVVFISDSFTPCVECSATRFATLSFTQTGGDQVDIWHNPDNSLFIEFRQNSGKTSRYTLSEELLLRTGVLKLSDKVLNGRRIP